MIIKLTITTEFINNILWVTMMILNHLKKPILKNLLIGVRDIIMVLLL